MSKSLSQKVKTFYSRYEEIISLTILVIWGIATITSSIFITFKFIQKPLTNEQITHFKDVAYDVYHEGANILYEDDSTSDLTIKLTENNIIIRSTNSFNRGSLTATPENGTLSFEYDKETIITIILAILLGCLAFLLELLAFYGFLCLFEIIKDLKSKLKFNKIN